MNTIENKGTIQLGSKVVVSDPCYCLNSWCQGVIDNVLPGVYNCKVEYKDTGDWGVRVAAIEVIHQNYEYTPDHCESFEVGVDSGTAGIYDYDYYAKYHSEDNIDATWYNKTFDCAHTVTKNPNYVEFDWDNTDDFFERFKAYERNKKISMQYFNHCDANTLDGVSFISSSGYGDGSYSCYTASVDGKVVVIRVVFIEEDEE